MDSRTSPIYHEHQIKQFCALHALNNLFGECCFTKKSLDDICEKLAPSKSWGNPHRSFFGFGNWDVNVVMVAIQSKNCEVHWWDKRNDLSNLDLKSIVGVILNIPNDYAIGSFKLPLGRRHWICIRPVVTSGSPVLQQQSSSSSGSKGSSEAIHHTNPRESRRLFYNLDSKFKAPQLIGNESAALSFLQEALSVKGGEMLVVVTKDTAN